MSQFVTKKQIEQKIMERAPGGFFIGEIAPELGIGPARLRKHVEKFVAEGKLKQENVRGWPRYSATETST